MSGALAICLILGVTVWLVVRDAGVPVPLRYDYDEGVYAATADAVAHGSRLYRDVFLSQPPVFVLMVRAMFGLFGASLPVARSAAVMLAAVWLIALLAILWARGSPWAGLFAVCLVLGRATFLDAAHTVQMEVPAEALACAAVALAAWGLRRPGRSWWIGAGTLAALAVMTKLTAATVVIPLIGAAVSASGLSSRARAEMLAAGALLGAAILFPTVRSAGFVDQVITFHAHLARTLHETVDAHLASVGQFLAAEWPLSLVALLGAWRAITRGAAFERSLLGWLAADGALLATLTPLWAHHLIILVSPMALLAGTALVPGGLRRADPQRPSAANRVRALLGLSFPRRLASLPVTGVAARATVALCAAAYLALGISASARPAPSSELERAVERIREAVSPRGQVLTDDPMVAFLAGRRVPDGLIDSSQTRIWAGHLSEQRLTGVSRAKETEAVVLWRGTFEQYFPRFASAAAAEFPFAVTASKGHTLFLKPRGRPSP